MKMRTSFAIVSVSLLAAAGAPALMQDWSVPTGVSVTRIAADGKGGCACVALEANGKVAIYWIDRKGAVRYQKESTPGMGFTILRCLKQELVYVTHGASATEVVHVDRKGRQTVLPVQDRPYATAATMGPVDKKYLFLAVVDTNQSPSRAEVIRYSCK
jgi:hypothetical protein